MLDSQCHGLFAVRLAQEVVQALVVQDGVEDGLLADFVEVAQVSNVLELQPSVLPLTAQLVVCLGQADALLDVRQAVVHHQHEASLVSAEAVQRQVECQVVLGAHDQQLIGALQMLAQIREDVLEVGRAHN